MDRVNSYNPGARTGQKGKRRRLQRLQDLANGVSCAASNWQLRTEKDGDAEKGCQKQQTTEK